MPAALPVLFVSHGSPMLALEPGAWGQALADWARDLTGVKAILVLSAHWEAPLPLRLTGAAAPATLHDFGGFPEPLYQLSYPAPGDPALASAIRDRLVQAGLPAQVDPQRPLDHGAWVPLRVAFPEPATAVLQLSLPRPSSPADLVRLGQVLRPLREQGVLLVASGGIVHNLGLLDWQGGADPAPWALAFETWVAQHLEAPEPAGLVDELEQAPHLARARNSGEHFDPLFFALGAGAGDPLRTVFAGWQLGSLSLRCWAWG